MILINFLKSNKYLYIVILTLFLNSCESFKTAMGLSKPVIDDNIVSETPELILPPEFEIRPGNNDRNSYKPEITRTQENIEYYDKQNDSRIYVEPRTKNFIAPRIQKSLTATPSDSIEKFRKNRKFTIGEWVFDQSVNNFRNGNIYYRPIYDKGYNFSRRYTPNSQIQEVIVPQPLLTPSNNSFYQYKNGKYLIESTENNSIPSDLSDELTIIE